MGDYLLDELRPAYNDNQPYLIDSLKTFCTVEEAWEIVNGLTFLSEGNFKLIPFYDKRHKFLEVAILAPLGITKGAARAKLEESISRFCSDEPLEAVPLLSFQPSYQEPL